MRGAKSTLRIGIVGCSLVLLFGATIVEVAGASAPGVPATFNGGIINLADSWGSASICAVTIEGTTCFSDQSSYQAWVSSQKQVSGDSVTPLTSCSSGLELFQNINYGGDELVLYTTATWINLSTYGFSDDVSSYKVGACSISMTDEANGAGDVYPGATSAGSDVSWIGSAWNDRVQSVYVY